jgi:hypothetical protein
MKLRLSYSRHDFPIVIQIKTECGLNKKNLNVKMMEGELMEKRTEIANAVITAGEMAQYDEYAKKLIGHKIILAHILSKVVDEFKGMNPDDIVNYIEGDPMISVVPVEPGLTNAVETDEKGQRIVGLNTENSEQNEGMARFDIIFYVRMRDGLAQIIVNVECQKDDPTEYKILNRAIFYVSRMISSQKERDFTNQNYDDIKRVYSIWVCMNEDENSLCHIHLSKDNILGSRNWKGNLDLLNIVMIGVTNELPEKSEEYELHRLLAALFSDTIKTGDKLEIMRKEYDIPITKKIEEEVNYMCNLGQGIYERGEARGVKIGEARGVKIGENRGKIKVYAYEMNLSAEEIAAKLGMKKEDVERIIDEGQSL